MDWIDDSVAVGNRIDGVSSRRRRREGIDIVIDARLLFTKHYLPSRRKPMIDRIIRVRDQLVEVSPLRPKVLIYCNQGRDRSPFTAMLYLSKRYGMSYQEAYELVRSKRRGTKFHWDWVEAVVRSSPPDH